MMLVLKDSDLRKIYEHCDREYPNEACGILAGHQGAVEKIYSTTNAEPSPTFYFMEPQEQFRVMKEMRQAGRELVGIYHSHTGSQAYPSSTDVSLAYYPEAIYLIVTLLNRNNPAARGFTIVEGKITEVKVVVIPEGQGT
jgi:[CysO sulfur-carrier protein]-S-L-cysteine hydrolase